MKKVLLTNTKPYFKANLHCHTTISDGRVSKETIKEHYKKNGYSVVAFTDHDVLVPHPELNDENFLALNGYEIQLDKWESDDYADTKTCHICFIALEEDNRYPACLRRTGYKVGNADNYTHLLEFQDDQEDFDVSYGLKQANLACSQIGGQLLTNYSPNGHILRYNGKNMGRNRSILLCKLRKGVEIMVRKLLAALCLLALLLCCACGNANQSDPSSSSVPASPKAG